MHARDLHRLAQSRASSCLELHGRIVAIHVTGELFERLQGNAETLLELREALVAQRDAQHRGDERFLTQAGAHPGDVVIAPGNGQPWLVHEQLDHLVQTRSAIPQVAADNHFYD